MDTKLNETLTGMAVDIGKINTNMESNTALTEKIADAIYGGNGEGLKTKVALNRSSIKRAWWWLAGLSVGGAGVAFYIIKIGILKG